MQYQKSQLIKANKEYREAYIVLSKRIRRAKNFNSRSKYWKKEKNAYSRNYFKRKRFTKYITI